MWSFKDYKHGRCRPPSRGGASLAVAEQRGPPQGPVLGGLQAPQLQKEDEVEVGATRFLIDRTGVQADRPPTPAGGQLAVGHVG